MAATAVTRLCFLQLHTLSCSRNICRNLVTVGLFGSDKTRPRRLTDNSYSHIIQASHCTQDDRLSRVPVDKLKITYSRSSGPGGQHVNKGFEVSHETAAQGFSHETAAQGYLKQRADLAKDATLKDGPVNTKADVRFHVQTADWIPEEVRREILLKNKTRVNKAGELIVTSEISRSQQRNLEDCLQKISEMIAEASQQKPEPSEEDIALRTHRLEKRNLERLKQKKLHAATKQTRRVDFD